MMNLMVRSSMSPRLAWSRSRSRSWIPGALLWKPLQILVFSKCPLGDSSAGAVALGGDPVVLLKTLPCPQNHYKTLVICENPMHFAGQHRRYCREGLEPDAPRRAHTHMFIKSFPTNPLGISGNLQSHVAIPNDDPQVQFELYRKGCGGSGHKE